MIASLLLVPGAAAKSSSEGAATGESFLGWIILCCFCMMTLRWLLGLLLSVSRQICSFAKQHRPSLPQVTWSIWVYCSFVTCAICMPDMQKFCYYDVSLMVQRIAYETWTIPQLMRQILFADHCFWWYSFGLAISGHCLAYALAAILQTQEKKGKIILQCRFVQRRRFCRHRRDTASRWNTSCHMPTPCLHVSYSHQCDSVSPSEYNPWMWDDLRGGGGGSATTARKRTERELLKGLQELLQSFEPDESHDTHHTKPQTVDNSDGLLCALKHLIQQAEKDPRNLLNRLKQLVSDACDGRLTSELPEREVSQNQFTRKPATQSTTPPHGRTCASVAAQPAQRKLPDPKQTKTAREKTQIPYRLWTEPTNNDSVITVHALRTKLEKGEDVSATLCACNYETATELRTLVKSHDLANKLKLALVLLYGECPADTPCQWFHVSRKGSGPELKKFPVIAIGDNLPAMPKCSAKTVDIPKSDSETSTLRITLPFCFSEYSWKQCQTKPANIVSSLLRDHGLQDGMINTYGWRTLESHQWNEYAEAVTGFLKLDPSKKEQVLQLSGHHGVFFEPLAKDRTATVIHWIQQNKQESDEEYFNRVCSSEHTNGFVYRRQGKSRLGLRSPEGALTPPETRPKVWEAIGIPPRWTTGTILKWLEENGWSDIELIAQPSRTRGWLFRAKNDATSFCFAFEDDKGDYITISQFFHQTKKPRQTPIRSAGSAMNQNNFWNSINGVRGTIPAKKQPTEIAATVPDSPMTPAEGEENAETKDSEMLGETKRPASSAQNTGESPDKKRANKQPDRGVSSTTEYQGYSFVDCGGTGDCAYRALAVAYALQDQRDQKEAVAAAKQLGATLRAQVSSHLKKYDHFKESFAVDPRWTETREDGPVPKSYLEWIDATARPNRWIDGPCLSTAATRLSRNIALWKWDGPTDNKSWVKQIVIPPIPGHAANIDQANAHPPLPLFLKDNHYVTLKPGTEPFPMHWHDSPVASKWDAGDNRGGTKSYKSWLPASSSASVKSVVSKHLKTAKSYRSWLPASPKTLRKEAAASAEVLTHEDNKPASSNQKKSYRNWLPSCSASSHFKATAASGKTKQVQNHKAALTMSTKPTKKDSKNITHEPILTKIGRPPKSAKVKKPDRKTAMRMLQKRHTVWQCPECQTKLEGEYHWVMPARLRHWASRHPEKPRSLIQRPPISNFEVTSALPPEQRSWSCPLCDAGLPDLPPQDRKRAIKKHCEECHPEHSVSDLRNLNNKKVRKPEVSRLQYEKWDKHRAKRYKTHDAVPVECPERTAKAKGGDARRTREFYCRKCLCRMGRHPEAKVTCAQRQKKYRDNVHTQSIRRKWWVTLKEQEPIHAANYATAMKMTFDQLDKFYYLKD